MRNVGAIVSLLNDNADCGFSSTVVNDAVRLDGEIGREGTASWIVDACRIEIPADDPKVSEDCNGTVWFVSGTVVGSATKSVTGILTGTDETPVIPGGPDAATIRIDNAQFDHFVVKKSTSTKYLMMKSGELSATVSPRLAVDSVNGACSVPSKHVTFSNVAYKSAKLHVTTPERDFDVDIASSDISAVHGQVGDKENALWGTINVWGLDEDVPQPGDHDGLDPEYDLALVDGSFACAEDLAQPISFDCGDFLSPRLAQNASRLSVRLMARIARIMDRDTNCGFASELAVSTAGVTGSVGGEGAMTLSAESCTVDLVEPMLVKESCTGVQTLAKGRLVVSGTKRTAGRLSGNAEKPVVPSTDTPVTFDLRVESFDGFELSEAGATIVLRSGALEGKVIPRVAMDSETGACSYASDVARFENIRYTAPADATIISSSGSFAVQLGGSEINAVSGTWGEESNVLRGSIELGGETYVLPTDPMDDGLSPDFEQSKFDAEWQCNSLQKPVSFSCDPARALAQGASQLTIQMVGKLAKLLDKDTNCGFSSPAVVSRPTITGRLGHDGGSATYDVNTPCTVRLPERTVIERDCNGKSVYASGTVRLRGSKTLSGIVSGHPVDAIVPTTWDPARIRIDATFEDFSLWSDPEVNILTVKSGRITGTVAPQVGQDVTTGACSIATPVAAISNVAYTNAELSISKGGLRFDLSVPSSRLEAQNGNGEEWTNRLVGEIVVGDQHFTVPTNGIVDLDPEYDQATFDNSYACIPNLHVPSAESECNMKQVLGDGVARLLAMSAGTIASQINKDDDCGFENIWVKINPSEVVGDIGDMGSMSWDIEDCEVKRDPGTVADTDCNGRRRFIEGDLLVDANRVVVGRRQREYLVVNSIKPVSHDAVEISLDNVGVGGLSIYEVEPGETEAFRGLHVGSGRLSATVQPIVGERADDPGTYDVPTPVAHITNISLTDAPVTLSSEGKTFAVRVESAELHAFNGSYRGMGLTNSIRGTVRIDGVDVAVSGPLSPGYDQQAFDATYACNPELEATIPAAN